MELGRQKNRHCPEVSGANGDVMERSEAGRVKVSRPDGKRRRKRGRGRRYGRSQVEMVLLERVRDRLGWLRAEDRELLESHVNYGLTYAELGRLTGVDRRRVARRVRVMLRGLGDDYYVTLKRHEKMLDGRLRDIAYEWLVGGYGYGAIAKRLEMSVWKVRAACKKIEAFIDERRAYSFATDYADEH